MSTSTEGKTAPLAVWDQRPLSLLNEYKPVPTEDRLASALASIGVAIGILVICNTELLR
jgi:hypothetical protein